ncbi:MAG: hypothetical protein NTZ52_03725 [Chlamydiae bacterium]|nr:hypothetical protein [Chlamydiota bacterium]
MKKKHKNILKLSLLILWPICLLVIGFNICSRPVGFDIAAIRSNFQFKEGSSHKAPSAQEFEKLQNAFSQKFYYLGNGAQCYAFVSEDQNYVIKFFKMSHLTPKYWLNYIPLPWLEKYRFQKIQMRERRRKEVFDGFEAIYHTFKEETGLLFIHFSKTSYFHDTTDFIDKMGKMHHIALNGVPFILQKRARMIYDYVGDLIEQGQSERALDSLISVLELIKARCKKGYFDSDTGVSGNYGFVDGRPIEIDLGRVYKDETIVDPVQYIREVMHVSKKIEVWLKTNHPELLSDYLEKTQQML